MKANPKKIVEPKVYGLIIEFGDTIFLSIQYAYSLEDAFIMAKLEFDRQNPKRPGVGNPLLGAKIGLFSIKTLKDLMTDPKLIQKKTEDKKKEIARIFDSFAEAIKPKTPIAISSPEKPEEVKAILLAEKNKLMKEIIKNKDRVMFEKSKELLTEAERRYIEEHIK